MHADIQTKLKDILADDRGKRALHAAVPQLRDAPIDDIALDLTIGAILHYANLAESDVADFFASIAEIDVPGPPDEPDIEPDPAYEGAEVPLSSARLRAPAETPQHGTFEIVIDGPSHGNPFVDVDLWADFHSDSGLDVRVGGFYDGSGRYVIRFLPSETGTWEYRIGSTARSMDDLAGTVEVVPSARKGPVHVDGAHFRYADGSPFTPFGTTVYAWTHQDAERETATLETLRATSFNKVRMCVFPKHYDFNHEDPPRMPFEELPDGGWDTTRFQVEFFQHLEERIKDLGDLGIQADVILFHPYDRWGFQEMSAAADDRYVRYVVRRLSGLPNVWWSLANEYDFMWAKRVADWERIGRLVAREDPVHHPLSIHNGPQIYDFDSSWITHCSLQKTDATSPIGRIDGWRARWAKPIVIDESGYEGDIVAEWGSLSAEEVVRRFWQGTVRGVYLTHGETYLNAESKLWWAAGGELVGGSPSRLAFLAELVGQSPSGRWEPLPGYSHIKGAGVPGEYEVHYFDDFQPRDFAVAWPEGSRAQVDLIDPWEMTITPVEGVFEGPFTVEVPGSAGRALRIRRLPSVSAPSAEQ